LNITIFFRSSVPPWSLRQSSSSWFQTRGCLHVKLAASSIIETLKITKRQRRLILIFFNRVIHIIIYSIFKCILKYLKVSKACHIFFFICIYLRIVILKALLFRIYDLVVDYVDNGETSFAWTILRRLVYLLFYRRLHI
jgi:hypothetical protein